MARSQLLKDIVTGKGSIENILLRLKVILSDLDYEPIINWVNGELQGYAEKAEIPNYRILKGIPYGTFIVNYTAQYTNSPVPLEVLIPQDIIDNLVTLKVSDSLVSIQNLLNGENRENLTKIIPTAFCHNISTEKLQIAGMHVKYGSNHFDEIISNVKSKLVEIVMELEKQFDNLDELDIKSQVDEDSTKKQQAVVNIEKIIYEGSVTLGDKNKISRSKLGHLFGGGKNEY